jgi:predicted dehydrogenase
MTIRWGILGTGRIAGLFAEGLTVLPQAELVGVGSRSQESADAFGARFNIPHRHASYESLANDPDIDVIYVATPHPLHEDNSLLCLNAGKAVLCEKPFTINANEAKTVIYCARQANLFLMEAMWTRFTPIMVKLRELLAQGVIGDVQLIHADFGFSTAFDPKSRLFDPVLGGGALLDIGVYPISLASMIWGEPISIKSTVVMGESAVDEQSSLLFGYDQGKIAVLTSSVRATTPNEAVISGTNGYIKIEREWWRPQAMTINLTGHDATFIDLPFEGNGYNYQAAEVMRCMSEGLLESPIMPLDESLAIMQTMDRIREQWGLVYPSEIISE